MLKYPNRAVEKQVPTRVYNRKKFHWESNFDFLDALPQHQYCPTMQQMYFIAL